MERRKFPDNILVPITPDIIDQRIKGGWKPTKQQIINHNLLNMTQPFSIHSTYSKGDKVTHNSETLTYKPHPKGSQFSIGLLPCNQSYWY